LYKKLHGGVFVSFFKSNQRLILTLLFVDGLFLNIAFGSKGVNNCINKFDFLVSRDGSDFSKNLKNKVFLNVTFFITFCFIFIFKKN
jgi:hypothetical protein